MENDFDRSLAHAGVKGMKWGQRRKLKKAQKAYDRNKNRNYYKAYNEAARYANDTLIPKINKKYSKLLASDVTKPENQAKYDKYINEYETSFNAVLETKVKDMFGDRPE